MDMKLIKLVSEKMKHIENNGFAEKCKISNIDIDKWEWPQGVGLFGMYLIYKKTNDKEILGWIISWYENNIKKGIPEKNINTTAPLLTLAYLAEETKNEKYMDMCVEWVEWIKTKIPKTVNGVIQHDTTVSTNKNQVWADTLFMTVLFAAKMAQILNDSELKNEVEYQILMHIRCLLDTNTGLFYHVWSFEDNNTFSEALWGRGNCWITAGIPLFIDILSDMSDSVKKYLINVLECQIQGLEKYQDKSGLWRTLINDETSYIETSGSAGFVYGISKAVNMGLIDEKYRSVAIKGIKGIKEQISDDGTVANVSYGTGVGRNPEYYKNIPLCTMAYGQALTLLALAECEE